VVTFKGVHHVGAGVSDMERSLRFYGDCLGFNEILFDYAGRLPGMERVTGRPDTSARVVFIGSSQVGPQGLGMIKLVQMLEPERPGPIPEGTCWGEVGVAEITINVHDAAAVLKRLVDEKGCRQIMPLEVGPLLPHGTQAAFGYIAEPDGGKVEFVEWMELWPGLHAGPRIEGLNHVAFGVSNLERSLEFYRRLGFTDSVFVYDGVLEAMNPWFPAPTEQRIELLVNYYGGGIEAVEHPTEIKDCRGTWGHLGAMEFAIEVTNIDAACSYFQGQGIELLCSPQKIAVDGLEWKYAYFVEPDNNYVSLIEQRF
jgi:catechol 2,3-dioxygenase-like lactoylglutathione lyase family enzyme